MDAPLKLPKDKILDAAELLFSARGFYGVSLREIAREAGVDVALTNYHFGAKRQLFDAVVLRRAEVLNAERMDMLDAVMERAKPGVPSVEDIIDAFTHPLLNRSAHDEEGWKAYFALVAQVNNSPEFGGVVLHTFFDPVVHRFIDALRLTMPEAADVDLYWSYHFLSGALVLTFAETGRIDMLSEGLCHSSDLESVHARLVPFIAAGFKAVCLK